jgi:hypothetical protein
MDSRTLEREIDQLYQLAPSEFTAARNALAKRAGSEAARVRALDKPPIAAWAVNQLYWRRRDTWDALTASAAEARRAHRAVLSGREADIRSAGKAHEDAVDAALRATLELLKNAGHPATDATRQAIGTTLRALPAAEPPGRLSRTLQPGGFEALAGLSLAATATRTATTSTQQEVPAAREKVRIEAREKAREKAREQREAARKRALEKKRKAAERELRDAEHERDRARYALQRAEAAVEAARARINDMAE